MKRSEFILKLALKKQSAIVCDTNAEFGVKVCDLGTSGRNSSRNSESFLSDGNIDAAGLPCSPLETPNIKLHQSRTVQHANIVYPDHNTLSIYATDTLSEHEKKADQEVTTFSNVSSEAFSIVSDSENSENISSAMSEILTVSTFYDKKQEVIGNTIFFSDEEENSINVSNIFPIITNEGIVKDNPLKTYAELKSVSPRSVIENGKIIHTEPIRNTEVNSAISYSDYEEFESSGSDYVPSELSVSSCESLHDFDQTKAKKVYKNEKLNKCMLKQNTSLTKPEIVLEKSSPYSFRTEEIKFDSCNLNPVFKESLRHYVKKPSARERPTICPICYDDVVTHFTRHLFRHHGNNKQVQQIQSLTAGSKERLAMVAALRKQGYFHLKVEKEIIVPTRTSKNPEAAYFVCNYCLGHYTKQLLYKHVKCCKQKPEHAKETGRKCLSTSQTFLASAMSKNQTFLNSARIKNEVFGIMRADDISLIAKMDPLICFYGEYLLVKHKRQQIAVAISNKIREMARVLKEIRAIDKDVTGFFDLLKPEMFEKLVYAVKVISGFNINEKSFKAPSLALHMGTNLKQICNVAFKIVLENRKLPNIHWHDKITKKTEIKDLKKLIEGHWCNEVSSLAMKVLQEKRWKKPAELPVTNDILIFQKYLNDLAEKAYDKLTEKIEIGKNYKILAQCVLSLTVMFNRKRVGDVQYLTIDTYNTGGSNFEKNDFTESLTDVERIISQQFKRVITGGKGSKPVPILFSKVIQKYIACLIKIRISTDLVPQTNPYLFANPGSKNKWMAGGNILRKLANMSGAQKPALLTSTRFRKHIATTLQLLTMQADEMEQIATFMGHTQKTHAEFYRLPQDIFQTAKVAKVLLLLEKGKGKEFKGKSLNDIGLDENDFYYSDSEDDDQHTGHVVNTSLSEKKMENNNSIVTVEEPKEKLNRRGSKNRKTLHSVKSVAKNAYNNNNNNNKISGRIRWTPKERKIVLEYFKEHINKKITPKKAECEELLKIKGKELLNKDWVRIKTFVYNVFRQM